MLCPAERSLTKRIAASGNEIGSLRSKRVLASSSRGWDESKKEESRSNFRAITRLETLATLATRLVENLKATSPGVFSFANMTAVMLI